MFFLWPTRRLVRCEPSETLITPSANWHIDAGLRIMVNTFSLNRNRQNHSYYQCGYAMDFPEYFGINIRLNRSLIRYRAFHLYAMSNLLVTRHSLLQRVTALPTLDSTGWHLQDDLTYFEPALAAELTIGLKLKVDLSPRLSLVAASGIGAIWMNYSHDGVSFMYHRNVRTQPMEGAYVNSDRGAFEFVGLDGLPIMYLGVAYKF